MHACFDVQLTLAITVLVVTDTYLAVPDDRRRNVFNRPDVFCLHINNFGYIKLIYAYVIPNSAVAAPYRHLSPRLRTYMVWMPRVPTRSGTARDSAAYV